MEFLIESVLRDIIHAMSNELPGSPEEANGALKGMLDDIVSRAQRKLQDIFGADSLLDSDQLAALMGELEGIENPTERARKVYEFHQRTSPPSDLPEAFEDWLNKR